MTAWLQQHPFWTYVIICVLIAYVYEAVFRAARLPVLKHALVYVLIAFFAFVLLFFQAIGLPIVLCLVVAVALMWMARVRVAIGRSRTKKDG
ncbi:MAG: YlaH-like family protein [Paenibacillaceae bacterium]|jgi:hypothetical protein|nr:YlaH-like family protein [Paenibacillaceae bacterium]